METSPLGTISACIRVRKLHCSASRVSARVRASRSRPVISESSAQPDGGATATATVRACSGGGADACSGTHRVAGAPGSRTAQIRWSAGTRATGGVVPARTMSCGSRSTPAHRPAILLARFGACARVLRVAGGPPLEKAHRDIVSRAAVLFGGPRWVCVEGAVLQAGHVEETGSFSSFGMRGVRLLPPRPPRRPRRRRAAARSFAPCARAPGRSRRAPSSFSRCFPQSVQAQSVSSLLYPVSGGPRNRSPWPRATLRNAR